MKLKSFNYFIGLLIVLFCLPVLGDEKIDIWKNKKETSSSTPTDNTNNQQSPDSQLSKPLNTLKKVQIQESSSFTFDEKKVFGIYEPASYDFDLNMWSTTKADDLRSSMKRLNKIQLSKSSNEILEGILLSISYPPEGMTEKEFVNLKSKAVEFLVNKNIASGNIKEGCEKIKFIDAKIKDAYLEKFKIYCLIFNDKKPEAQLLLDLLREQEQSNKFYDDKINFLLGVTDKTSKKIDETNLLNFYLSSITTTDFKYEPTNKTKPEIWKYLNSANLIRLEDFSDKEKLNELEVAANNNQLNKNKIFEIYKKIPFNLNTLINAKNSYQSLFTS